MKQESENFEKGLEQDRKDCGKLRIFFGYADGVGKTFRMLNAAKCIKQEGYDVVIGYVECYGRKDTLLLAEELEKLPVRRSESKGALKREFDLDSALIRKPDVILIDDLAHSNGKGCRHAKRYQDVEELLRSGIDVYTTVNVEHMESLNDIICSISGRTVEERFPDRIFDQADQVEFLDMEPEDLLQRMKLMENRSFPIPRKEELTALREIALRRMADRLSRKAHRTENGTVSKGREHILVCLSSSPSNEKVIRTAARMSEAFHGNFTALFVENSKTKDLNGNNLKKLREHIRLAEEMGAQISTVYGEEPAVQIAEYARVSGVTKIVLGRTNHKFGRVFRGKSLADKLADQVENMDIYIIPESQPLYKSKRRILLYEHKEPLFLCQDAFKTFLILAAVTVLAGIFFNAGLRDANIITVYILGVLLIAVWTHGYLFGAIGSLLSVSLFSYLFTTPRFTFRSVEPDYPVTFVIMLTASILSSSLATRVKKQERQASQKAYYTELLMNGSQKLQQGKNESEILGLAAEQLSIMLERPILYSQGNGTKEIHFNVYPKEQEKEIYSFLNEEEYRAADWVVKNNKRAGATTNTFSHMRNLYMSVRGSQGVMGVVGIPCRYYPQMEVFEKNLMIAILNECGLIMERKRFSEEKQAIEMETQQERLRSNLLRAVSHDLRTPLTGICGNAGVLMEKSSALKEEKKQEIYHSIYDDAMWLVNLTENLLSITRIENGSLALHMDTELVEDVFEEALTHLGRNAKEYKISMELPDDLIMAQMDTRLIIQVIINIVNNALKYTPAGSEIILKAEKEKRMVRISISDNGPGIPQESKEHLFEMFYTASRGKSDTHRGMGLGLSLCRSIVLAHGGQISVSDNIPHGAVFSFTLPLEEVQIPNV